MATIYERMLDPGPGAVRIAGLWWAMALRGVGAIVLGMLALSWPAITLFILVLIFAAYCMADAVFSIVLAIRGAKRRERWLWPALHALVALAAAAVAILYPGITTLAFIAMLIAWAMLTGVLSIVAAFRLDGAHGRWWLVASGAVSLVLAGLLIAFPAISLLTLTWMIAFQAFLVGSLLLGTAFRLRIRNAERTAKGSSGTRRHEPQDARSPV